MTTSTDGTTHQTLLVIDDDKSVLESLSYFLEDAGFTVLAASNGESGIEELNRHPVNCILTDLRMPGLSGLDVITAAHGMWPLVPIVVISGADDIRSVTESFRIGAWDYIIKPIEDMALLEHRIGSVLEKARLLAENQRYQESLESLVDKRTAQLNNTVESLRKTESELKDLNENLERTVEDRTRKLETAMGRIFQDDKMLSLSRLVTGIAHEVNTPLGVSISGISYLREKMTSLPDRITDIVSLRGDIEECVQAADLVQRNLTKTDEIIRRFQNVNPGSSGEARQEIILAELLHLIVRNFERTLADKSVEISVHCEEDVRIRTYPLSIMQVLEGLIDNSLSHAYPEGQGGRIEISVSKTAENVRLDISDDGIGMEAEHQARIFDPFYTTSRNPDHHGLGLSIVWNTVVQFLGGSIECLSSPGNGTRFRILLANV